MDFLHPNPAATPTANYLPHTPADVQALLTACGVASLNDLFADIPAALYHSSGLTQAMQTAQAMPLTGLDELTLEQTLTPYAHQNTGATMGCFLGGGAYHRYVPAAVAHIANRSEFYTAYTPYQPEVAQGTLQVIYEFQSMVASLTGLPVANASVYDGANAVTEAVLMALRITGRHTVVMMQGVHPHAIEATQCYLTPHTDITVYTDHKGTEALPPDAGCVVVQTPDYYGTLWDLPALAALCQAQGILLIVSADPVSLGVLPAPGLLGADIVVGDLQPLGNGLSFGGPYAGYMACKQAYLRQLPGRLVSQTTDATGQTAYCLTLQTREQHIRRQKATSNICTNQALNVLKATVMLTLLGPTGLAQLATLSVQRAHWLANALTALPGVTLWHPENRPFFNEFVVTFPLPTSQVLNALAQNGLLGGIPLQKVADVPANTLLVAVTEMTTPAMLQTYVNTVAALLQLPPPAGVLLPHSTEGCPA
jgi:glycine dehydrogenase subunit 1